MALDREKILQTAQKFVDKKKYDRAIAEYQKIVQSDPNDARTLLKIGDLQARMETYAEAIATYDRVGQFYAAQGFSLKAIAVYKQIRELIKKYAPHLADRYGHIVPKLAEIYTQLGLTSDALAAYDEVATRLQRAGRDRDAIDIFRRMVSLDSTNPLPHLRLAEACCRVQSVDEAIDSFWTAAELLIRLKRRDDALKVIERILHFRQDPRYARVAADLYLERGEQQDGMQALAKLQLCFQQDPKNLETLELLSRAFLMIKQEPKALEVKKEIARIAREQHRDSLFSETIDYLLRVAPNDEQVHALAAGYPSLAPESSAISVDEVEIVEQSVRPQAPKPRAALASHQEYDIDEDIDFDQEPYSQRSVSPRGRSEVEIDEDIDLDIVEVSRRPAPSSIADVVIDEDLDALQAVDEAPEDARAHARKALLDAESFRGLRLYSKALETLRIALEIEPRAIDIREKLRDVLLEAGDQDGAIGEMITLAAIHMETEDHAKAETELYGVLDVDPSHPTALEMIEQLGGFTIETGAAYSDQQPYREETYSTTDEFTQPAAETDVARYEAEVARYDADVARYDSQAPRYDSQAPLPSYDLEEISAVAAMAHAPEGLGLETDDPFEAPPRPHEAPLPSFPLRMDEDLENHLDGESTKYIAPKEINPLDPSIPRGGAVPSIEAIAASEAIEAALEEAEFYASRGLHDDARMILTEQLARTPNHPLLMEKLRELEPQKAESAETSESAAHPRAEVQEAPDDTLQREDERVFDIAASLDALDQLEEHTRSSRPPSSIKAVEEVDVDQVFAKFKEGVRHQVSESDSSTHYDLGVAYKEMGLLPDAVSEFEIAARDPKLECMCFAMIGMIHLEQGDLDKAAGAYVKGLSAAQKTIDQEMSLYYDLGNVYEMKGSTSEALYYFQKIARRDPGYRDVKDRIEALRPQPTGKAAVRARTINDDDEFDAAFDELFETK